MFSPVESPTYAPPPANDLLEHLKTLQDNFEHFDTAKETVKGKPRFGGGADNNVSREDLTLVSQNKDHKFTDAEQAAARYLLDHPQDLAHLDVAGANDSIDFFEADGRICRNDVNVAVRDAQAFDGAKTFHGEQPAIEQGATDDAQQMALIAIRQHDSNVADPQQVFTDALQKHKGDNAWLQRFFGALGAEDGGALLFDSLYAGGESRAATREALDSLFDAGLLSDADLQAVQIKTDPLASPHFTLKDLMDADGVQRQIEGRRDILEDMKNAPRDSSANDAYEALLTVQSEPNSTELNKLAERYGIDPALLKGAIAAELDFDFDKEIDGVADGLWRNTPLHLLNGPGASSVHDSGLQWALEYLKGHPNVTGAEAAQKFASRDPDRDNRANFMNSAEQAAICLAALTAYRKEHGASTTTATDMAVTWGAYRQGVKGLTPDGKGYTIEGFLNNQVEIDDVEGEPHTAIGGNAYQSEPYFSWLLANP